ncbi:MAG: formate--tetrahydrofolate ligase, partial [Mycoplasma sp.]
INHARKYNIEPMIILNVNNDDTDEEIQTFEELMKTNNLNYALSNIYNHGTKDTGKLVEKIISSIQKPTKNFLYSCNDSLITKVSNICKNSYGIKDVVIPQNVQEVLSQQELQDYSICMAKTQYSLSSDDKVLNVPVNGKIEINKVEINHAAKFVILICGTIWKMPGLSKKPRAKNF